MTTLSSPLYDFGNCGHHVTSISKSNAYELLSNETSWVNEPRTITCCPLIHLSIFYVFLSSMPPLNAIKKPQLKHSVVAKLSWQSHDFLCWALFWERILFRKFTFQLKFWPYRLRSEENDCREVVNCMISSKSVKDKTVTMTWLRRSALCLSLLAITAISQAMDICDSTCSCLEYESDKVIVNCKSYKNHDPDIDFETMRWPKTENRSIEAFFNNMSLHLLPKCADNSFPIKTQH